jgi:hypothetical protein
MRWDNFFSLCANYPKEKGKHFAVWLRVNKPGMTIYHVVGAQESRHDLCLMEALAIYMNSNVCFHYARYVLRLPKKQDNIFAKVLVCIYDIGRDNCTITPVCNPLHIVKAIDTLQEKMMDVVDDPTKILDQDFMMSMFSKYIDMLPLFKKYWEHLFEKKQMVVVASESGAKVL